MDSILNYIKLAIATIATAITYFLGTWDTALIVLVTFMALDYFTGVLRAYLYKVVSSNTGLKGIAKKAGILVILIVAVLLDRLINSGTWVFRTLVCYFFISNEGISIIENCAGLGLPIPAKLQAALEQLKDGEKKENKERRV